MQRVASGRNWTRAIVRIVAGVNSMNSMPLSHLRLGFGVGHGGSWRCKTQTGRSGEELRLSARRLSALPLGAQHHHHPRSTAPRMVLLVATDRIRAAWEALPVSRRQELDLPPTLDAQGPITHEQLLRLSKAIQHDATGNLSNTDDIGDSPTVLSSLLRGTKVYVPPPPKKPEPVRPCSFLAVQC